MGKGGHRAKSGKAPVAEDDDVLLAAAIAEVNRLKVEAENRTTPTPFFPKEINGGKGAKGSARRKQPNGKEPANGPTAAQPSRVFSMEETLMKMDQVMTFTISKLLPDGGRDVVPSPSGIVTFYTDATDAKKDMVQLMAADAAPKLMLDFTPLGRAFAVSQGLMRLKTPVPTKIQFSRAMVEIAGQEGVPSELREQMQGAGPFPLFYTDKLGGETFTPVFFTREDLASFWVSCGGAHDAVPVPTVTDLRIVVARTLQEAGNWEALHFVPPSGSEALTKQLMAKSSKEAAITRGFVSGTQKLKEVAKKVAIEDGDEPPELS